MKDLHTQLAEALLEYARFVHREQVIFCAQIQVRENEWFEQLEPTYRLDSVVKQATKIKLPLPMVVYSKN